MYTVKKLAELAGISVRTLHYYDEIGLLKPTSVGENGYRHYSEQSLFRLQQILLYREMDLELNQIKQILEDPNFDLVTALQSHRRALQHKSERLEALIHTIDRTIMHLIGELNMSEQHIFEGFSPEKQKQYEEEATRLWGDQVKETAKTWNSYSEQKKQAIMQEGRDIYLEIVSGMDKGPESPEIQALLARWHAHLRYFYEPTPEILAGLGKAYNDHPDFNATFTALHPDLPAFLMKAIAYYVERL